MAESMRCGTWQLELDDTGTARLEAAGWTGLALRGLRPALRLDGADLAPQRVRLRREGDALQLDAAFAGDLHLCLCVGPAPALDAAASAPSPAASLPPRENATRATARSAGAAADGALLLTARLRNDGPGDRILNDVQLLGTDVAGSVAFAADGTRVQVLEQGAYWGHVRRLHRPSPAALDLSEDAGDTPHVEGASDNVWVAYDAGAGRALLAGFLTSERWQGRVEVAADASGSVQRWRLGHDGADVRLPAGSVTPLEEALLLTGPDPWHLLETYGDRVAARHGKRVTESPPVTWCSWYPYRLGVTEDRLLETGRIAASRLGPLGFDTVVADLGWQAGNLPSTFDENARFPRGLRWLADQLGALGVTLGAWSAPYSISALDPLAQEHPEVLIPGEDGRPAATGTWFWEPHGQVHILDLTSPGGQDWLRARMQSLAERGVAYLKPDFIGTAAHPLARRRHDDTVAAGGGLEAGRIGQTIMRQALPQARLLNCGGPEMPTSRPGADGGPDLLYTCNDTGNTGFITTGFQRRNTQALACHLWKNRRWGILQPSCLVVGLPGSLDEARLRATIAFLAGGQIDISDTLQSLPEDRWAVLTATLPSPGVSARPVDLFEPLAATPFGYDTSTKGEAQAQAAAELPAGSVWHLRVDAGWDAWDLVGLLAWPEDVDSDSPQITRFGLELRRLGLDPAAPLEAYEFWSGQYLGALPGGRTNPGGYTHPGDFQDLLTGTAPGRLDAAFYGPGARLLCLRARREHPWVAGTGFHQSCGTELREVAWDEASASLSGVLRRPAGESAQLTFTAAGRRPDQVEVDGRPAPWRLGAGGSVVVPVITAGEATAWRLRFA